MSMIYEIPGPPIAWKRPRLNGKRFFDAQAKQKKDIQYLIQNLAERSLLNAEALKVVIEYQMPIPKSWSRRRRLDAIGKPHVSRPDLSNLIKFIEDALNGIMWKDDSLIYELHCRKFYSEVPRTSFIVDDTPRCGRSSKWPTGLLYNPRLPRKCCGN